MPFGVISYFAEETTRHPLAVVKTAHHSTHAAQKSSTHSTGKLHCCTCRAEILVLQGKCCHSGMCCAIRICCSNVCDTRVYSCHLQYANNCVYAHIAVIALANNNACLRHLPAASHSQLQVISPAIPQMYRMLPPRLAN